VTPSAVRQAAARAARPRRGQPGFSGLPARPLLIAAGVLAVVAAGVLFPVAFPSPVATTYGFDTLIFVACASAWNLFSGYSGYLSLGHAVFFGSGVYAVAVGAQDWHLTGTGVFGLLPLAAAVGGGIAIPLGLVALRVRRHTFVVSGAITGLAGGLWYYFIGAAAPQSAFDPLFDLSLALMAFFGGLGTVAGPVLGALVLEPAQQWLTARFTSNYLSEILLGVLFLVVIIFMPRGVLPTASERLARWRASWRRRREPGAETRP